MSFCQEGGRTNGYMAPSPATDSVHQSPPPKETPDQPPDIASLHQKEPSRSPGLNSGPTENGKAPNSPRANTNLAPEKTRKRVKRVSREELQSILAKRVKKELDENCDLVKLQETCRGLQVEVSRWKAESERLASQCAKLEQLINSSAKEKCGIGGNVKVDVGQAVIPKDNSKKENNHDERLPSLPARVTPNDSLPTPLLQLTQTESGLEVQWNYEGDQSSVASYELFAFRKLTVKSSSQASATGTSSWKKVGDVKSIPLPMKCTLSQFKAGSTYSFAVRAKDKLGGVGPFSDVKIISLT